MKYGFLAVKYNNEHEKIVTKRKVYLISRSCPSVAKEYLIKKYVDTNKYDFIEREY